MSALPQRKLFTVNEYDTMIKAGVFDGTERVELIEGEFVKKRHKAIYTSVVYII